MISLDTSLQVSSLMETSTQANKSSFASGAFHRNFVLGKFTEDFAKCKFPGELANVGSQKCFGNCVSAEFPAAFTLYKFSPQVSTLEISPPVNLLDHVR